MNIGMLWFDNDPKVELIAKIERAANYYRIKYGKTPTLCFVHPSMLPTENEEQPTPSPPENDKDSGLLMGGVEVRSNQSVLPNHFWIGVNRNNEVSPTYS